MTLCKAKGDLFEVGQEAIAHGCNCLGFMGAGFARLVQDRYSREMMVEYRRRCNHGLFKLGDIMFWEEENQPFLYNLATQYKPGPNATYGAIAHAVDRMLRDAEKRRILEIGIPRIGCGIGGLDWDKTENILLALAEDSSVDLVVYSL